MNYNLFKFEIKKHLKVSIIFTGVLCVVMFVFLIAMYPSFANSKAELLPLLEKFPDFFLDAFHMDINSFFSFVGMLSFAYIYIGLIGGIMALIIGISIFAHETRYKCSDFLITKPISRKEVFLTKLLASGSLILCFGIVYVLFALLLFAIKKEGDFTTYFLIVVTTVITQFVFLGIGILLGVVLKRVRSVSGIATGCGIFAFLINTMQGITKSEIMKLVSPLQYFSPSYIAINNSLEILYLITAIVVAFVTTIAAYFIFLKKEL